MTERTGVIVHCLTREAWIAIAEGAIVNDLPLKPAEVERMKAALGGLTAEERARLEEARRERAKTRNGNGRRAA
jgi:hypothetical protein